MQGNIKLPVALEQKYDLVQQPPLDDMYFGREIGSITFSKMTEEQAVKLVRIKSPYIKLKATESEKVVEPLVKTIAAPEVVSKNTK